MNLDLNKPYSRDSFLEFLDDFLPDFSKDIRPANKAGLKVSNEVKYLGESEDLDLAVFELIHTSSNDARVSLATDGFKLMKDSGTYRALIAYKSESEGEWRLSLLTATPKSTSAGRVTVDYSNPRRYSFYLGPDAKVNTPYQFLIANGEVKDLKDLKSRFSIEVVNKEFYQQISEKFTKLVGGTLGKGKSKVSYKSLLKMPSTQDLSQVSLEFAVRLIGRVIFCWFLREKKSKNGVSLMPKELLSLEAINDEHKDYYHSILEPIFFEVLNKRKGQRREPYGDKLFSLVPYLNGGLFAPHDDDYYKRLNGDYQSRYHNTLVIPDKWFREFFEVLETYNFTIDENTTFDEELSIDPEMLGRIFENLLAEINPETGESARKSTGSYYTPRVIVDYMVDESLLLFLKQKTGIDEEKLRAIITYDLTDDSDYPINASDKQKITDAIEIVKLLDPACGSGAFPIGALQKMVFILQQIDPDGKMWFKKQMTNIKIPELKRKLEKEHEFQNFDYIRKLGIIRESIYGVDIQPIATEISRLRCFLTLVVDQYVKDGEDNRGIEPLPNLEFKFVTANTLIGLPMLDKPEDQAQQTELFDDRTKIEELKDLRDQYFAATNEDRLRLMHEFSELQKTMYRDLIKEHGYTGPLKAELTDKLTDWNPFSHKSTSWFDPEWMFGLKDGFDIVIANPPYVDSESMTKNYSEMRQTYKELFETTKGNWDLFVPFIENGLKLLSISGYLSYIVPNKLIAAKYALAIRNYISNKIVIEVRDYSRLSVFVEADVYPITILVQNSIPKNDSKSTFTVMKTLDRIGDTNVVKSSSIKDHHFWDIFFYKKITYDLLIKLLSFSKLREHDITILGAATVSEAYQIKSVIIDSQITDGVKRVVNTGTIDKYQLLWGIQGMQYLKDKYLYPVVKNIDIEKISETRLQQANSSKIIIAGMSNTIEAYYDNGEYLAGKSTSIALGEETKLLTLLGIINSQLINFFINKYFKSLKMSGGYLNISKEILENIPMAVDVDEQLAKLAYKINRSPSDTKMTEIDQMVYKLYDLSPDEIEIVEKNAK